MRFASVVALCVAPLVLASSFDAGIPRKRSDMIVRRAEASPGEGAKPMASMAPASSAEGAAKPGEASPMASMGPSRPEGGPAAMPSTHKVPATAETPAKAGESATKPTAAPTSEAGKAGEAAKSGEAAKESEGAKGGESAKAGEATKEGEAAKKEEGAKSGEASKEGEAVKKGGTQTTSVSITESDGDVIMIWITQGGGAATETVNPEAAAAAPTAAAVTHQVMVGGEAGLVYTPDTIKAAVGDMVVFTFMAQNHTVTQSAFSEPCVKIAGSPAGMDTGFMANPNNSVVPAPQMAMMVNVSTPLWFYCSQNSHCGKGMVFSINPTAEKSQEMFKAMAVAKNGTSATPPVAAAKPSSTSAGEAKESATPPKPVATPSAPAAVPATMATGSGQGGSGGVCSCSCLCGVEAFPSAAQGIGAIGGMPGSMPMAMMSGGALAEGKKTVDRRMLRGTRAPHVAF